MPKLLIEFKHKLNLKLLKSLSFCSCHKSAPHRRVIFENVFANFKSSPAYPRNLNIGKCSPHILGSCEQSLAIS